MVFVGKQVVLKMAETKYNDSRALVLKEKTDGFFEVQILELESLGETLVVTKYQIKDWIK